MDEVIADLAQYGLVLSFVVASIGVAGCGARLEGRAWPRL